MRRPLSRLLSRHTVDAMSLPHAVTLMSFVTSARCSSMRRLLRGAKKVRRAKARVCFRGAQCVRACARGERRVVWKVGVGWRVCKSECAACRQRSVWKVRGGDRYCRYAFSRCYFIACRHARAAARVYAAAAPFARRRVYSAAHTRVRESAAQRT